MKRAFEWRACEACGFTRKVKIKRMGFWARFCGPCDLLRRAQQHEAAAGMFRRRATELIRRRKRVNHP